MKKTTPSVGNKVTPLTSSRITPSSVKPVSLMNKPGSEKVNKGPLFNIKEKTVPTSTASVAKVEASKKSTNTPNFHQMHQKHFNNSKPITSCVERVRLILMSHISFLFVTNRN